MTFDNHQQLKEQEFTPEIRRARIQHLAIYEISEDELNQLEKGNPGSIILNFTIFSFSVFVAFLITLLTVKNLETKVFITFVIFTALGGLAGPLLLCIWIKQYKSTRNIAKNIRSRMPPSGIAAQSATDQRLAHFILKNAKYGISEKSTDVTKELAALVTDLGLTIEASNKIAGDPIVGTPKFLFIKYISYGKEYEVTIPEGEKRSLP